MEILFNCIKEINPYCDIDENTDLISEHILDSTGIMLLISMIEERFDIVIGEEDFSIENFQKVKNIHQLINKIRVG